MSEMLHQKYYIEHHGTYFEVDVDVASQHDVCHLRCTEHCIEGCKNNAIIIAISTNLYEGMTLQ